MDDKQLEMFSGYVDVNEIQYKEFSEMFYPNFNGAKKLQDFIDKLEDFILDYSIDTVTFKRVTDKDSGYYKYKVSGKLIEPKEKTEEEELPGVDEEIEEESEEVSEDPAA